MAYSHSSLSSSSLSYDDDVLPLKPTQRSRVNARARKWEKVKQVSWKLGYTRIIVIIIIASYRLGLCRCLLCLSVWLAVHSVHIRCDYYVVSCEDKTVFVLCISCTVWISLCFCFQTSGCFFDCSLDFKKCRWNSARFFIEPFTMFWNLFICWLWVGTEKLYILLAKFIHLRLFGWILQKHQTFHIFNIESIALAYLHCKSYSDSMQMKPQFFSSEHFITIHPCNLIIYFMKILHCSNASSYL